MAIQRNSSLFKTITDAIEVHSKPLSYVLVFCLGGFILMCAHKMWVTHTDRAAQYDFSALMTEYEITAREKNPEWEDLLEKFETNYAKHSRSSLLPYYLSYKARILLNQNKKNEALTVLDVMISSLVGSPLRNLYETERSLVQLDMEDESLQTTGLEALKKLAYDTTNNYRDTAQFYLGRYYWANDEIESARQVWQKLVDEQRDEKMAPSPWIHYVQSKLDVTIV